MSTEIILNSYDVSSVVTTVASHFKTQITDERTSKSIQIPVTHGMGNITAIDFKDGLSVLVLNCKLNSDLILRYKCEKSQPLRMLFYSESDQRPRWPADLSYGVSSMLSISRTQEQSLVIPAHKPVYYYCIDIDRMKYTPRFLASLKSLPSVLQDVFRDTKGKKTFVYQGRYSPGIAQCITNMDRNVYTGLVRSIYLESQAKEIIAMHIQQFIDDHAPGKKPAILRKRDVELVHLAKKKLLENLADPPTIRELALQVGINENKLKRGFRILFNTSVNKMLQDERLMKAKALLAESSYPVREVALMVGYRHAGHFTSKFRKKYGILPRDFIRSMSSGK